MLPITYQEEVSYTKMEPYSYKLKGDSTLSYINIFVNVISKVAMIDISYNRVILKRKIMNDNKLTHKLV